MPLSRTGRRVASAAALVLVLTARSGWSEEPPPKPVVPPKDVPAPQPAPPLPPNSSVPAPDGPTDPSKSEVFLPAYNGWMASLVYDNDVGVWMIGSYKVFPTFGAPEVVGLDDKGRLTILSVYSGKWNRYDTIGEGKWLGALSQEDMDPEAPGPELYTGGTMGNLYQVVAHAPSVFSTRVLARVPGRELNTSVGADFLPDVPGNEIAFFTWPGGMYLLSSRNGKFQLDHVEDFPDLVRQAVVLPGKPERRPRSPRPRASDASRR
jgi:hypothetical protein